MTKNTLTASFPVPDALQSKWASLIVALIIIEILLCPTETNLIAQAHSFSRSLLLSLPPFPISLSYVSEANIRKSHSKGFFHLTGWATEVERPWERWLCWELCQPGELESTLHCIEDAVLRWGQAWVPALEMLHELWIGRVVLGRMPWNCQIMFLGATLLTLCLLLRRAQCQENIDWQLPGTQITN